MKNLLVNFIILFILISSCDNDNQKISISGTITGYPDSTRVILMNLDTNVTIDTALIFDNQFDFTTLKSEPIPHGLIIGDEFIFFWLEDSEITINGEKDNLKNALRIGGKLQKQDNDFQELSRPLDLLFDGVNAKLLRAFEEGNEVETKSLEKEIDKIIHDRITIGAKYIKENPNNLLSAFALSHFIAGLPKSEIKSLYENLSSDIKESRYAKSVSKFLDLSKDIKIGDIAEDFQLPDLNGNLVGLNDFKGKFVLLEFWSSGCGPCRNENKNLLTNFKKYKNRGFEIISITADVNKNNWLKATKEDDITWASLQDFKSEDGRICARYNVKLIDRKSVV